MFKPKKRQQKTSCSDSGFTILESLVALLVAAILLAAIAPVLVISTATRVQARRVELASQAAKTFIDGIRSGAIAAPSQTISISASTESNARRVTSVTVPTSVTGKPGDYLVKSTTDDNVNKMALPTSATGLYCFTRAGTITTTDCTDKSFEYYIQAARIAVTGSSANDGYRLAIRVYRADVDFTKARTASTGETNKKTQNPYTGGLGDRQSPLLEMTTDIANTGTSFNALCQRLGVATNKGCN
jgi:prepilin-type N-terminal cleavage/methylation domain-containing protein